jgi:two-component system, LytTR family, response regulator
MLRAVAIDDEANALGVIREYSSRTELVNLVNEFKDPVKGLSYIIDDSTINLVFLDIRMAKLNGIELIQKLPPTIKVVFTTAYSDYAQISFDLDAADYLLKPFSYERFERALKKVMLLLPIETVDNQAGSMTKLAPSTDDIILVKTGHKMIKLRLSEILYMQGTGNYITIHTLQTKVLVLNTMRKMEELLSPYQFIRIHKSYIISFQHIDSIDKGFVIINNVEIPISETYKESLDQFLDENAKQV